MPRQETSRSQPLAEDIPDGSFGGARTVPRRSHDEPGPDPQAAEHMTLLLADLASHATVDPRRMPSSRPAVTSGMCQPNPDPAVSNRKAA